MGQNTSEGVCPVVRLEICFQRRKNSLRSTAPACFPKHLPTLPRGWALASVERYPSGGYIFHPLMSKGSYHGFVPGRRISTDHVIALCEQRIRDGHIKTTSIAEKQGHLATMRDCGHSFLIWTPQAEGSWGASPFNPNNWRSLEEKPITTATA